MTILFAASEMAPFCKTGGLADVIGDLPPVLAGMGHNVSVMLPGYSVIDRKQYGFRKKRGALKVPVGKELKPLSVSTTEWKGVAVHLLENEAYFDRKGLYGDMDGDYADNGQRFVFFSRAVIEAAKHLGLKPDIVHAHDWQAGLIMAYLATIYKDDTWVENCAALFTIHNLGYQGIFPENVFSLTGLPKEAFDWRKTEYWGKVSFLKAGIVYADAVSAVSETYAEEITHEELGFGMHGVFAGRKDDLYGIVNGIDTELWNPAADMSIPAQYSADDMSGKKRCRSELLEKCRLKADKNTPVFGMVTRLDDQKGLDIFEAAVGRLTSMNLRIVVLGAGTKKHNKKIKRLASRYPDCIHAMLRFDSDMARLIYAGSDGFLMPSRYEPCGLGQLIAMRYGTLPVVHSTGGLAETVRDIGDNPEDGDGFSFGDYSSDELAETVARAVMVFRAPGRKLWNRAVNRAMAQDFSWKVSAKKYVTLYNHIRNHRHT